MNSSSLGLSIIPNKTTYFEHMLILINVVLILYGIQIRNDFIGYTK